MKRHCRSCLHYYVKDATIYTYIGFHSLEIGPLGETAKKVERYMGAYTRVQTLFGTTSTLACKLKIIIRVRRIPLFAFCALKALACYSFAYALICFIILSFTSTGDRTRHSSNRIMISSLSCGPTMTS